jgi:hypothetical protein
MTEAPSQEGYQTEIDDLKKQNLDLQQAIVETKRELGNRLMLSELRAEALRAGIIDLDGLKLIDLEKIRADENGGGADVSKAIEHLKSTKPWLFQIPLSSTVAAVPPAQLTAPKRATEMTDAEYRIARAQILGQRAR